MPINTTAQADALVAIINQTRADAGARPWNTKSLYTLLQQHHDDTAPYRVIAQAAIAYAGNPHHRTPAMLFEEGPWWPSTGATADRPRPPRCEDHDTEPAHHCRCCIADKNAGTEAA